MQMNKVISILLLCVLLSSCVERYYYNTNGKFSPHLVVDALIEDDDSVQTIILSKSTSPEITLLDPLSNCIVSISDDDGNQFHFYESETHRGSYNCAIEKKFFKTGTNYTLHIITPDGSEYASDSEELTDCPPVDSVKFQLLHKPTTDQNVTEDGLQFYIDLKADNYNSRFYRWTIDETWEYHSEWPKIRYIDVDGYHEGPIDYSKFICYRTSQVPQIFILSTQDYSSNNYMNYKLQFVNDHTQKLLYKYSILIKQYSISETAYDFWKDLVKNSQESIGLFETQPAKVEGNIHNVLDVSDRVLGIFCVSSVTTKRINILGRVPGLSFAEVPHCSGRIITGPIGPGGPYPIYLVYVTRSDGTQLNAIAEQECVDCTIKGGTTVIPSFLKEK
jgi:hypothetical protein